MDQDPQTRRQFCTRTCSAAAHVALGAALASALQGCGGGGASPTSPGGGGGTIESLPSVNGAVSGRTIAVTIDAGSPLAAAGGAALVRSTLGDFLVTRAAQDAFSALTAVCTHSSCTITGLSGQSFVCPCHGSRFDRSGGVVNGPAPTALRQFATQFASGVLTISA